MSELFFFDGVYIGFWFDSVSVYVLCKVCVVLFVCGVTVVCAVLYCAYIVGLVPVYLPVVNRVIVVVLADLFLLIENVLLIGKIRIRVTVNPFALDINHIITIYIPITLLLILHCKMRFRTRLNHPLFLT